MKAILLVLLLASSAGAGVVTYERVTETILRESGGNPNAVGLAGEVITEAFLDWVAMVESGNNPNARGKLDELGAYQLRAIAVREVNRLTGSRWKHRDALDPKKARIIARHYLLICSMRSAERTRESIYRKYRGLR